MCPGCIVSEWGSPGSQLGLSECRAYVVNHQACPPHYYVFLHYFESHNKPIRYIGTDVETEAQEC